MIQTNELRLGNIIALHLSDGEYTEIEVDHETIKWCNERNEDFNLEHKPIRLEEDHLLSFGFEYSHQGAGFSSVYKKNNVTVVDEALRMFCNNTVVHFVHELQNVYRGETGEELNKINKPKITMQRKRIIINYPNGKGVPILTDDTNENIKDVATNGGWIYHCTRYFNADTFEPYEALGTKIHLPKQMVENSLIEIDEVETKAVVPFPESPAAQPTMTPKTTA